MNQIQHKVTILGSCLEAVLPRDFALFFRDDVLIARKNNTPMEIDGYNLYLALKALEKHNGADFRCERTTIVDAVVNRLEACRGLWKHGWWTGSEKEVHMRFTSAAIRLLVEAFKDGLVADRSIIPSALKRHLAFSEPLDSGRWFLHDSLEMTETGIAYPPRHLSNKAWGSSQSNHLVLNTHLDTLVTLLYVLQNVELGEADRQFFLAQLESGTASLKLVLRANESRGWRVFESIDSYMRHLLFRSFASPFVVWRVTRKALLKLYFPLRYRIRSRLHGFVFSDGYLERDVGLDGRNCEYHLVNVWDLAKFLVQAKTSGLVRDEGLLRQCGDLVDRGIDYAVGASYWFYLVEGMRRNGQANELCEAIIARLRVTSDAAIPEQWISAYCRIRQRLSPSPAILGYDPLVVEVAGPDLPSRERSDFIRLGHNKVMTINYFDEEFSIKEGCAQA